MHRDTCSCSINATADRVWSLLTDVSSYHRWHPTLVHAQGRLKRHAMIGLQFGDARAGAELYRVSLFQPPWRMAWRARLYGGLCLRTWHFELYDLPDGRTGFVTSLQYSSGLGRALSQWAASSQARLQAFTQALKHRAERPAPPSKGGRFISDLSLRQRSTATRLPLAECWTPPQGDSAWPGFPASI